MGEKMVCVPAFTTSIVCIPERFKYAKRLQESIPDARIMMDIKHEGSWPTHRQAMLGGFPKSHHLVMEEDTAVCKDFIETVNAIIECVPDRIVSLFDFQSLHKGNDTAKQEGRHFFTRDGASGQAVLFPVPLMQAWVRWCDQTISQSIPYEDIRLHAWLKTIHSYLYVAVPNIVEHILPSDSAIDKRLNNRNRISPDFIGSVSGKDIKWSEGLEKVPDKVEMHAKYDDFYKKWFGSFPPFKVKSS